MDVSANLASGTVGLASHLLATTSPAIRVASQAVELLPDAMKIAASTEALTASAEAVHTQAQQADKEELKAAANEVLTAATALAESVATFIGRANEVAVAVSQLGSPAVRLASFAQRFLASAGPGYSGPPEPGSQRGGGSPATVLTESDVDRLLTQKLDQTLAEFREEMRQFKEQAGEEGGAPKAEGSAQRAKNAPGDRK